MKADFTRNSFRPENEYSRVLMQQGRLQLDADWNEQVSIFWHFLRSFTRDLVGPYAGPANHCGFAIVTMGDFDYNDGEPMRKELGIDKARQAELRQMLENGSDFLIGPGRFYVDGIPCYNPHFLAHSKHSHLRAPMKPQANSKPHLVYLDVWERFVTSIEDPNIREPALNGADTCVRSKVHWQVKTWSLREDQEVDDWSGILASWEAKHRGALRARTRRAGESSSESVSTVSPGAGYRGAGNQLYRVEVHQSGRVGVEGEMPTFKWSRENGSVAFPIVAATDTSVTLANLGRDSRSGLAPGDWVEVVDDDIVLGNRAEPLRQVASVRADQGLVTFAGNSSSRAGFDATKHPLLRRWDQKQGDPRRGGSELRDGAVILREGDGERFWIALENGVQVQFTPAKPQNDYRTGDYWTVPARVATGDLLWPQANGEPQAMPPEGVQHVYAPLALVSFDDKNQLKTQRSCRLKFDSVPSGF